MNNFYAFNEFSCNRNYIFKLEGKNIETINEIKLLCTNNDGKTIVISVPKNTDGIFKYEYQPEQIEEAGVTMITGTESGSKDKSVATSNIDALRNMVFENVLFGFDKSNVQQNSYPELSRLMKILKQNPSVKVEIGGHTDHIGPASYNQLLSERRAQAVVNQLIKLGIAKERLIAKGYGESRPIAPNVNPDGSDNSAGRRRNRRTEIRLII